MEETNNIINYVQGVQEGMRLVLNDEECEGNLFNLCYGGIEVCRIIITKLEEDMKGGAK